MADLHGKLTFQLGRLRQALAALDEAVASDSGDKKSRDSILLSFVFTFEMAWRSLKVALAVRGADAPDYAAGTLKSAFAARLISDADLWMDLRDARNEVSRAYDQDKAIVIASLVRQRALQGFHGLLDRLQRDDD